MTTNVQEIGLARAEQIDEIERILLDHPELATPEFLKELDRQIDEIERTGKGDWWGLTRARVLLGGYRDGKLADALLRCRTRDLLPLGPDDLRRRVDAHPELLDERSDALLRHWASQQRNAGGNRRAEQIELRRDLLREIAAERIRALTDDATAQEHEFQRSGNIASLDQALAVRKYVARDPAAPFLSYEVRAANIQAVSRLLQHRYRVAGLLQDIADAISEPENAAATLPEGHPVRQALLAEMANALNLRFRELRDPQDIDRAIAIFDSLAALPELPGRDPESRCTARVNTAVALLDRCWVRKAPEDLTRAIGLLREVVSATPAGSPRRLLRVNNLASALYVAFRDTGDRTALREAIALQREVVQTEDAAFQVHALAALARSLDAAVQAGEAGDREPAEVFRQAVRLGLELNVGAAMWAGMTWGRAAWAREDWDAAAEAYGYCADGARMLFSRQGSEREASQEIRLSQFREVASRATFALARAGRCEDAAVVFELGRAQLLIEAIERGLGLRRAPDLDAEIRTGVETSATAARHDLDVDEIGAAAQGRPLLYLVPTDRGGVALLVENGKVTQVALPDLREQALAEHVRASLTGFASPSRVDNIRALDKVTRWLWDAVMGPVLEKLEGACEVVLVPGGLLGLLPLHAAWTPDDTRLAGRRYALDMTAFRYAPSARSLAAAGARAAQPLGKALLVADPEPVTAEPLVFAADEAEVVKWLLPQADLLAGLSASLPQVSRLLSGAGLVHLACHGFADLDRPLESGVILAGDETLSVRRIRELKMTARLAVLSACKTGVAGTPLPDEAVAMPTGLLQAGVAGVVASLWAVPDLATTMLMAEFYRRLVRDKEPPAAALRGAQKWMRDTTNPEKSHTWEAGAGDWLPPAVAERLRSSLFAVPGRVYAAPWWWAAFVHVGA